MTEKEAKGKEMELYKKALEKWGNAAQKLMMIEEMSELTKELCKTFREFKGNIPAICEELADVDIMLMQMKYIFPEWKYHKIRKLERLEGALKK